MRLPDIYEQMIISLLILAVSGMYQNGLDNTVPQLSLAVATAALLDLFLKRLKLKRFVVPKSGIITGLLVGMVLNLTSPWYAAIVTAAAAIALKHLIIYKGRNVFNPASLGLVLCGFVFGFGGGWWSSSNPALIIILGILVMYRVKGYYMVVPYLVLFFLLFTISKSFAVTADSFLNPIILFFSFFMLTEHKTAPHFAMQRVIYGSVIAVFAFVLFYYLPAYFLLLPLLIGNICGLVIEQLIKK